MNQLISMTENGVTTNFTYDANGNLTQKQVGGTETWNYVYDYENRLIEVKKNGVTVQKNWYDGDGKRIKKQENGDTVVYIYVGIQVIYEKVVESGKETKYIGRVAKIEKVNGTETITYFHTDHLGSTRAITDSSGNLTATLQYDPFGEVRSGVSNGIRYTFTGKEQDATGLYYYGARFYDPKVGRFITRDPIAGKINDPQTQNRYVYVGNNPLRFIDPTGCTMTSDNTYYSRTGNTITIHLPGGKTVTIDLNDPNPYDPKTKPAEYEAWKAGYVYYGKQWYGLFGPGAKSYYESEINIFGAIPGQKLTPEQRQAAIEYAKGIAKSKGLSDAEAQEFAEIFTEGFEQGNMDWGADPKNLGGGYNKPYAGSSLDLAGIDIIGNAAVVFAEHWALECGCTTFAVAAAAIFGPEAFAPVYGGCVIVGTFIII